MADSKEEDRKHKNTQTATSRRESYKNPPTFFNQRFDEDDGISHRPENTKCMLEVSVECLHHVGIDVSWTITRIAEGVKVKSFYWLIGNHVKGPLLAPDADCATIEHAEIGSTVTIQIVAVCEEVHLQKGKEAQDSVYQFNVVSTPVVVEYGNLVSEAGRITVESVRCNSVVLTWQDGDEKEDSSGTSRAPSTPPDSYCIMWWKAEDPEGQVLSAETTDTKLHLSNLCENTEYTVLVESRGKGTYQDPDGQQRTFRLSSAAEPINFTTPGYPEAPKELRATHITPEEIHLQWELPHQNGSKVLGLKLYTVTTFNQKLETVACHELSLDRRTTIISGLKPETQYQLHLVVVTEEYLEKYSQGSISVPRTNWSKVTQDTRWLPCVSLNATTAPSPRPTKLRCNKVTASSVHLRWDFPKSALECLINFKVTCKSIAQDVSKTGQVSYSSNSVDTIECSSTEWHTIFQNLVPCMSYRFCVIACSKIPVSLSSGRKDENLIEMESDILDVRVPPNLKRPELLLVGFSSYHMDLKWWKPDLAVVVPKTSGNSICSKLEKISLLAYQMCLGGNVHTTLPPHTSSVTLPCAPDREYEVKLCCIVTANPQIAREVSKRWKKPNRKQSLILRNISDCDVITSRQLCVRLPQPVSGSVVGLEGQFHPVLHERVDETRDSSSSKEETVGHVHVKWKLPDCGGAAEQGIVGYDVNWMCSGDGNENTARVTHDASCYDIPVCHKSCVVDVSVHAIKDEGMFEDLNSPSLQIPIPGPPDPPSLCCSEVTDKHILLEWSHPRLHGDVPLAGYQMYMNKKPIGKLLNAETFKAGIPCQPQRQYTLNITAVASDATSSHSKLSNSVIVQTPEASVRKESLFELINDSPRLGKKSPRKRRNRAGDSWIPETIAAGIERVTDHSVTVVWSLPFKDGSNSDVFQFKVSWSSVAKPKELDVLLKSTASQFIIRNCASGTTLFLIVYGLNREGATMCRSQQLTVQTNACIAKPVLVLQKFNFDGCTLTWSKPEQFGEAKLSGYLMTINGSEIVNIPANTSSYSFTEGKLGQKYTFTLKALCCIDELSSEDSDPVTMTWPGVLTPDLKRASTTRVNSIGVKWDLPLVTGGAAVTKLKVLCMVDRCAPDTSDSNLPETKNPCLNKATPFLSPQCQSVEFTNLSPHTRHLLYLDVYLEGMDRAIRSRPLVAEVTRRPSTPKLRCVLPALEERKRLDAEACQLIDNQDRILQSLYDIDNQVSVSMHEEIKDEALSRKRLGHFASLTVVESKLRKYLELIAVHTGTVTVALSWNLATDDGDATITGYKVMVNGKPHGFMLHSNVSDTTVKLSAYDGQHQIRLVALTNHPVGHSDPSDAIMVDTTPFLPFTHCCLHSLHSPASRYPNPGCCSYLETYLAEISSERMLVGCGRSSRSARHVPPPSVMVYDLHHRNISLLVPTKLSNKRPTLILFWTHWCLASQNVMSFFVHYAKMRMSRLTCSAVCCMGRMPLQDHYPSLMKLILKRGWKTKDAVRHTCSCQDGEDGEDDSVRHSLQPPVPELFGITSVPTLVLIHPEGFLGWRGLFPATRQEDFNKSMDEKVQEMYQKDHQQVNLKDGLSPPITPRGRAKSVGFAAVEKPPSFQPRRMKYWSHLPDNSKLITVNKRPYSSGGFRRSSESASSAQRQRPRSSIQISGWS
ncbi:Titin [Holothuria leucospilota]|uniref:Titin n=1 Tax=Holothuria leucospilota TaxID=206669 RepID=A0A9Q1CL34_HOLLE|nr:Titin [Holothuria leucospilota]